MVFAGEASWRWKMMVAVDRSLVRVLLAPGGALAVVGRARPGRDHACPTRPSRATRSRSTSTRATRRSRRCPTRPIDATLTLPGGATQPLKLRHADPAGGRYTAALGPEQPGLYRVHAEARRGATALGAADRWMYVGGADREFADPRLNEGFLRRVARNSGGRYVRAADASKVPSWLQAAVPQNAAPERRDLWHEPWAFALVIAAAVGRVDPAPPLGAAMNSEFRIRNSEFVRRCATVAAALLLTFGRRVARGRRGALRAGRHRRVGRRRVRAEVREVARRRSSTTLRDEVPLRPAAARRARRDAGRRRAAGDARERPRARSPISASG